MADPYEDFDRWDSEHSNFEMNLPHCAKCEEAIYDDEYFEYQGQIYCRECFDKEFQDWTIDEEIKCPVCGNEFDCICYRIDGEVMCQDCVEDAYKVDID